MGPDGWRVVRVVSISSTGCRWAQMAGGWCALSASLVLVVDVPRWLAGALSASLVLVVDGPRWLAGGARCQHL